MITDGIRPTRCPWRAVPRAAATFIAVAGLAPLVCGCGGAKSSSTTSTRSAQTSGALAFSDCMRSHGVPNFPDPANGGSGGPFFPISRAGISEAASRTHQFVAELNECGRLTRDNVPESFG